MDIKTLEQALKLQNDFSTRLTQSLVMQRTGKMPAIEVLLKEKEQWLTHAQAAVEIAIKERAVAASRWDERVAQRKVAVAKLQGEMKEIKEQFAKRKDTSKDMKTEKIRKKSPSNKLRK